MTQPRGKQINFPQVVYLDASETSTVSKDGVFQVPSIVVSATINDYVNCNAALFLEINGTSLTVTTPNVLPLGSTNYTTPSLVARAINSSSVPNVVADVDPNGYLRLTCTGSSLQIGGNSKDYIFGPSFQSTYTKKTQTKGIVTSGPDGGGLSFLSESQGRIPRTRPAKLHRTSSSGYSPEVLPNQKIFARVRNSGALTYDHFYKAKGHALLRGIYSELMTFDPNDQFSISYVDKLNNKGRFVSFPINNPGSTIASVVSYVNESFHNIVGNLQGTVVGRSSEKYDGAVFSLKFDGSTTYNISVNTVVTLSALVSDINTTISAHGSASQVDNSLVIKSNTVGPTSSVEVLSISPSMSRNLGLYPGVYSAWTFCENQGGDLLFKFPHPYFDVTFTDNNTNATLSKLGFGPGKNTNVTSGISVPLINMEVPLPGFSTNGMKYVVPAYLEFGDVPADMLVDLASMVAEDEFFPLAPDASGYSSYSPAVLNDLGKIDPNNLPERVSFSDVVTKNITFTTATVEESDISIANITTANIDNAYVTNAEIGDADIDNLLGDKINIQSNTGSATSFGVYINTNPSYTTPTKIGYDGASSVLDVLSNIVNIAGAASNWASKATKINSSLAVGNTLTVKHNVTNGTTLSILKKTGISGDFVSFQAVADPENPASPTTYLKLSNLGILSVNKITAVDLNNLELNHESATSNTYIGARSNTPSTDNNSLYVDHKTINLGKSGRYDSTIEAFGSLSVNRNVYITNNNWSAEGSVVPLVVEKLSNNTSTADLSQWKVLNSVKVKIDKDGKFYTNSIGPISNTDGLSITSSASTVENDAFARSLGLNSGLDNSIVRIGSSGGTVSKLYVDYKTTNIGSTSSVNSELIVNGSTSTRNGLTVSVPSSSPQNNPILSMNSPSRSSGDPAYPLFIEAKKSDNVMFDIDDNGQLRLYSILGWSSWGLSISSGNSYASTDSIVTRQNNSLKLSDKVFTDTVIGKRIGSSNQDVNSTLWVNHDIVHLGSYANDDAKIFIHGETKILGSTIAENTNSRALLVQNSYLANQYTTVVSAHRFAFAPGSISESIPTSNSSILSWVGNTVFSGPSEQKAFFINNADGSTLGSPEGTKALYVYSFFLPAGVKLVNAVLSGFVDMDWYNNNPPVANMRIRDYGFSPVADSVKGAGFSSISKNTPAAYSITVQFSSPADTNSNTDRMMGIEIEFFTQSGSNALVNRQNYFSFYGVTLVFDKAFIWPAV